MFRSFAHSREIFNPLLYSGFARVTYRRKISRNILRFKYRVPRKSFARSNLTLPVKKNRSLEYTDIFKASIRSNIDTRNAIPYSNIPSKVNTEYNPLNSIISIQKDIRCHEMSSPRSKILENWQRTRIYFACGKNVSGPRGHTRFRLFTCVTTPNSRANRKRNEQRHSCSALQLRCAGVVVFSLFTRIAPA